VLNLSLAEALPGLPPALRAKGIIPAGYLIEQCGLKGTRIGGAVVGVRHANFIVNDRGASATDIRRLIHRVKSCVKAEYDVELEEEILYLGDWSSVCEES
jgi:UDP-N-acetylmuramate dehydrogenase